MNLFENPFCILGASPSDTRQQLYAKCDSKSLLAVSDDYAQALQILTHPAKRLSAELRWFPGCAPEEATRIQERLCAAKKTQKLLLRRYRKGEQPGTLCHCAQ
jgi:hypothetical protein